MSNRANLELELFELRATNTNAASWGAAVGARSERIREIESELRRMDEARDPAPQVRDDGARKALENVRVAILEADPQVLCCTLWMPDKLSKNETVVDYIDAALSVAPPVHSAAIAAEPVADSYLAERKKVVYQKLAEEGGGTWATYMMMDIEEAFAAPTSPEPDAVREAIAAYNEVWESAGPIDAGNVAEVRERAMRAALSRPAHGGWRAIDTRPADAADTYPIQVCGGDLRGTSVAWYRDDDVTETATHWAPMLPPIARNDRGSPER